MESPPTGVTAAFNLNLLERINRELGGTVPIDAFRHEARWNPMLSRVEMHLVATTPQVVQEGSILLIDGGCKVEGYSSDISRTFVYGEPTRLQRQRWEQMHRGQEVAFDRRGHRVGREVGVGERRDDRVVRALRVVEVGDDGLERGAAAVVEAGDEGVEVAHALVKARFLLDPVQRVAEGRALAHVAHGELDR